MSNYEQIEMLERDLSEYGPALNPEEVAKVLGCTRRYVDKLLDKGILEYFVLDETKERQEKRVLKVVVIAYMINRNKTKTTGGK